MRVPWTARRSNQSILKEVVSEHSLEGLMLELKLQDFGNLMQRADLLEKTLMLGKSKSRRRRGRQRTRWLDGITDSMDMSLSTLGDSEGQGSLACCSPWGHKELDTTEQLITTRENIPLVEEVLVAKALHEERRGPTGLLDSLDFLFNFSVNLKLV